MCSFRREPRIFGDVRFHFRADVEPKTLAERFPQPAPLGGDERSAGQEGLFHGEDRYDRDDAAGGGG
jgi:hypothetical protein